MAITGITSVSRSVNRKGLDDKVISEALAMKHDMMFASQLYNVELTGKNADKINEIFERSKWKWVSWEHQMNIQKNGKSLICIQILEDGSPILVAPQEVMTVSESITRELVETSYIISQIKDQTRMPWYLIEYLRLNPATGKYQISRSFNVDKTTPPPMGAVGGGTVGSGVDMYNRLMPPQFHIQPIVDLDYDFIPAVLFRVTPNGKRTRDLLDDIYAMADTAMNKLHKETVVGGSRFAIVGSQVSGRGLGQEIEKWMNQISEGDSIIKLSAMSQSVTDIIANISTTAQTEAFKLTAEFLTKFIAQMEFIPTMNQGNKGTANLQTAEVVATVSEAFDMLTHMREWQELSYRQLLNKLGEILEIDTSGIEINIKGASAEALMELIKDVDGVHEKEGDDKSDSKSEAGDK